MLPLKGFPGLEETHFTVRGEKDHFLIVPEKRLLVCYIEKVGSDHVFGLLKRLSVHAQLMQGSIESPDQFSNPRSCRYLMAGCRGYAAAELQQFARLCLFLPSNVIFLLSGGTYYWTKHDLLHLEGGIIAVVNAPTHASRGGYGGGGHTDVSLLTMTSHTPDLGDYDVTHS